MSAHSIGSATVSFGLVSVPVKLFSAGESAATISFNWLHNKDGARLKQQYVCSKGGERAYKLLTEALKKTGRVALGQWAARGKQYLILVRPLDGGLAMEQLKYPEELRSIADVPIPKTEVKKGELDMAIKVIDQGTSEEFRPEAYKDNVRRRILDQIQQKVEGHEITEEPTEAPKTQIIDLMEALKASLKGGKGGADRKPAKRVEAKGAPKRKVAGGR